jgi:hypothetical protein
LTDIETVVAEGGVVPEVIVPLSAKETGIGVAVIDPEQVFD